ncbi:MAG: hypothetical protein JWP10_745 [Nocardioidaceae bacterium]|nr:hypothetical protein [Nocardioidaceae bacterium]
MTDTTSADLGSLSPIEFQQRLDQWIKDNEAELTASEPDESKSVEEATAPPRPFQTLLWNAGWLRAGWPEEIGGTGGSAVQRAQVYEGLAAAGYALPETLPTLEVLTPALLKYAPALAHTYSEGFLSGKELWCQGFSETEAGSDMASMRTRAKKVEGGWSISGHKVWNSYASVSDRCVLLARTGEQESRHKGISAFLVDMDTPGVEARPIKTMTSRNELSEIYFDNAFIADDRIIGEVNQGWEFAMYLLQWERGMYAWMRQAWLNNRLDEIRPLVKTSDQEKELGAAYMRALALRLVSRRTIRQLDKGIYAGPEVSIDKLLLSSAEQIVLDLARSVHRGAYELGDEPEDARLVGDFFYTRSASIYGGAAEIQRDVVAQRVLGLPRGR